MNKPKHPANKPSESKPAPTKPTPNPNEPSYYLSRRDAAAAAPTDVSVTGEEDPGAGLEFLVKK